MFTKSGYHINRWTIDLNMVFVFTKCIIINYVNIILVATLDNIDNRVQELPSRKESIKAKSISELYRQVDDIRF